MRRWPSRNRNPYIFISDKYCYSAFSQRQSYSILNHQWHIWMKLIHFWLGEGNISTYEWPIPTVLTDSRNKTRIETGGQGPAPVCQQARRQARIQTLLPTLPFSHIHTSVLTSTLSAPSCISTIKNIICDIFLFPPPHTHSVSRIKIKIFSNLFARYSPSILLWIWQQVSNEKMTL